MQNENREVAIRLSGVKKMYKLGQIGGGTLQGDLQARKTRTPRSAPISGSSARRSWRSTASI